jgi:hypothetical protein
VDSAEITPEPDADEREAILAALAAHATEKRPVASGWAEELLPARADEKGAPYPE